MLNSIFTKTIRDLAWSFVGWSVALALLSIGVVAFYPTLQSMTELESFLRTLPKPIQAMIGDPSVIQSLEGFLSLKLFNSLPLFLGLFGLIQGAVALAGEEERGTLDILLAQPIRRWRVALEKFAAQVVVQVGMCSVIALALCIARALADLEASPLRLTVGAFAALPVGVFFGALAQLGSSLLRQARVAGSIAGLLVVVGYFIQGLAPMSSALQSIQKWTPFYYSARILPLQGEPNAAPALLLFGAALPLLAASIWCFERKDLRA